MRAHTDTADAAHGLLALAAQKTCVEVLPAVVSRKFGANEFVGTIKEGSFGCQHLEGPAKYVWSSGTTYEGSMTSSVIEGRGKFCWPDGSTYEGELQEGKRHGQGTYVAKDGVTRYEGQWASGKRHGYGKLVYSADGTSFYDGQWAGGKKHGRGKQVWPSGNCYDGEWDSGSMRGQGTMSWTTVAGQEMYSGSWEENNPHGEGTHTWCTPAEPASPRGLNDSVASFGMGGTRRPAAAPAPQQQQVNRYAGQWQGGSRSGFGTFYYANGANYAGEWKDHVKHGRGRHTLEDGRSYESDFVGDRPLGGPRELLEGDSSAKGAAENPVGKIIEVPDLFPLALPSDQSGFPATVGTGYQDPVKVLREVHNGLLRHLSTMRDLYKSYRLLAPTPGEDQDPFVMRTRVPHRRRAAPLSEDEKDEIARYTSTAIRENSKLQKLSQRSYIAATRLNRVLPRMALSNGGRLRLLCRKTEQCRFYQNGACTRGAACTFAHGEQDVQKKPDFQRTKRCPTVATGQRCEDPRCPFAHTAEEFRKFKPELAAVDQDVAASTKKRSGRGFKAENYLSSCSTTSSCGLANSDAGTDDTGNFSLGFGQCNGRLEGCTGRINADASWSRQTTTCSDSSFGRQTSDSGCGRQAPDSGFSRKASECSQSVRRPKPTKHNTRLCSFYMVGKCKKPDCTFAHGAQELKPRAGHEESASGEEGRRHKQGQSTSDRAMQVLWNELEHGFVHHE
ncbi:unnamed protein product [Prorocentrum cordatum]|uniref:C3H1-type domain-containing protein n=1 Tax=Prorocentrum cordatum TaxID=2364126 RepID=A0ABN9VV08_9DINO|nr:unnamed protein product [Polarella glacialis]